MGNGSITAHVPGKEAGVARAAKAATTSSSHFIVFVLAATAMYLSSAAGGPATTLWFVRLATAPVAEFIRRRLGPPVRSPARLWVWRGTPAPRGLLPKTSLQVREERGRPLVAS